MITPTRVTDIAISLISIPSVTGTEQALADWLTTHLHTIGFPYVQRLPVAEAGDTVIAWTDAPTDAPGFMLNFHLDTFPPASGWPHDPFQPRLEGNRLYGIGAHDMKGGAAAVLAAAETLLANPALRSKRLLVAATSDEENWSRGAHAVINSGLLQNVRYCLIPEPTLPGTVRIGARGRHVFHLRFQGIRANVAYQDGGINAIADAARVASRLCDHQDIDLGYNEQFAMRGTLAAVGLHSGGTDVLMPEAADLYLDHHIMPGYSVESTAEQLRWLIDQVGIAGRYTLTWDERPTPAPQAYMLPLADHFVQSVLYHHAQATGTAIRPTLGRSVCDANHFAAFGNTPTIVCGPDGGNTCEANEYVLVDSMLAVANTYVATVQELLGA
jgi:succinyl-diaminopimelate desuccinylase